MGSGNARVTYNLANGNGEANGLFPPIVCTGTIGEPIVTVDIQANNSVQISVTFAGTQVPIVLQLQLGT
jgi:hypothetical protein